MYVCVTIHKEAICAVDVEGEKKSTAFLYTITFNLDRLCVCAEEKLSLSLFPDTLLIQQGRGSDAPFDGLCTRSIIPIVLEFDALFEFFPPEEERDFFFLLSFLRHIKVLRSISVRIIVPFFKPFHRLLFWSRRIPRVIEA